jgi:phosphoglycolate phosphatase
MNIPERFIFWDWNGTLLDDTITCLSTMNDMLRRRGMPTISLEFYREVFGFPVIDYYRKVGFDFRRESFECLSVEFIDVYNAALNSTPVASGAKELLDYFVKTGKRNVIVSAMKQDMLVQSVCDKGLIVYFTDILGLENICAAGKSTMAINFVQKNAVSPDEVLVIGDTTHDYEVAQQIGCRCILVADGHQTAERLKATGALVVGSLIDLLSVGYKELSKMEKK